MAKMTIFRHGRQGSPMVAKCFQGPRETLELCAPYTIWQAVLKGLVILRQKAYFGPDYCACDCDCVTVHQNH